MFKQVPRAKEYEMSISGEIRRIDGKECTFTMVNEEKNIVLRIDGEEREVNLEWLRLITHFEVDLPSKYFWNVYFEDTFKWQYSNLVNKVMNFIGKRPEYKPGFRYIPNFTRYAVSKEGEVIDTYLNKDVPVNNKTSRLDYLKMYIYNPDKSIKMDVVLHKLVALAWVRNPEPLRYYMCNHKDGNKQNPLYSNLEWTNHKGNNQHAADYGLRLQATPCKIRLVETGEVIEFISVTLACKYMGINRLQVKSFNTKRLGSLFAGKYEIKRLNDVTPWKYESLTEKLPSGRYIVTVIYEDGREEKFYDVRDLRKSLNVKLRTSVSVWVVVDRIRRDNPNLKILVHDTYATAPIQAYEISTGKIYEESSISKLAKLLNINRSSIGVAIKDGETRLLNGYAFRYKTDKKWNTNFSEYVNKPKCILAINVDGKEYELDSIRAASLLTKINRLAIRRSLKGLQINTNWHFKYI